MARTRTLSAAGEQASGVDPFYRSFSEPDSSKSTSAFGNSAQISANQYTITLEEDTAAATGTWGTAGATRTFRYKITMSSTRSYTSVAGNLAATTDTQTTNGPWEVYTWPNLPARDPSEAANPTPTVDAHCVWSASLDLTEHYDSSGSYGAVIGGGSVGTPWELCTAASFAVDFTCDQSVTIHYVQDSGAIVGLTGTYSYTSSPSVASAPNRPFNAYSITATAIVGREDASITWGLTASGPGISFPSGGPLASYTNTNRAGTQIGSTAGSGTGTLTGSPLAGTLTNSGNGWSTATLTFQPNWADGATAQVNRYEDAAGLPGVTLGWGTAALGYITDTTDGSGAVAGASWVFPSGGGYLADVSGSLNLVSVYSVTNAHPNRSVIIDPSWADGAGRFLMSQMGSYQGGALQPKFYQEIDLGRIQIDDSHNFDQFSSLTQWQSQGTGAGSFALDGTVGGIKITATTAPYGIQSKANVKALNCYCYRYFQVQLRADAPNTAVRLGIGFAAGATGAGAITWRYWDLTISAANTWETHEIDLAIPDADSEGTSPMNYVNHPNNYFASKGCLGLRTSSVGNVWIKQLTGYLKQDSGRIPTLLLHDLNANGRGEAGAAGDAVRQYKGTTLTKPLDTVEVNQAARATPQYARGAAFQGDTWGRLIVNGVVAMDIRPDVSGTVRNSLSTSNAGFLSPLANFWKNLITLCDNAANDTGLHVGWAGTTPTSYPSVFDLLTTDWKRTSLWSRLNDTPGAPVTLNVGIEPSQAPTSTWGYPGMGDAYNDGAYGERRIQHYHGWFGGEVMGVLDKRAPVKGATVKIVRHPSGSVEATATSNRDGFWRAFCPYGTPRPYSNNPSGAGTSGSPHYLKQFTAAESGLAGNPGGYPNTTLGNAFAPFTLQSKAFKSKDSSNFAVRPDGTSWGGTTRELVGCYDRFATYFGFGDAIPPFLGIDLAANPVNWIFRAYRKESPASIQVGRLIYGQAWADVSVATDHAGEALPTLLAVGRTLLLLYHTDAGAARLWWSNDSGDTWQDRGTPTGIGAFPRAALLPDRTLLVVSYVGSGLSIHQSTDWQTAIPPTFTSLATVASVPEQLAVLRVDRYGIVHRVWTDGTDLLHSYRKPDGTWSSAATMAAGEYPSYALGLDQAALTRYVGTAVHGEFRAEDYEAASTWPALDMTALSADPQQLGLLWDHNLDLLVAALDAAGAPLTFYAKDLHTLTAL